MYRSLSQGLDFKCSLAGYLVSRRARREHREYAWPCLYSLKNKLLYQCLKVIVRLAIKIFCRKIIINKPEVLNEKGPLLLACNHPNSFLDGVIFDTLFKQPVYT